MHNTVVKPITITRVISFVVLVTIIVIISILFYRVMANFLLPLFLAALLVVIFRPMHLAFLVRCGGRARVAAGLTTATILLIVLAPIGLVLFLGISEGISLTADLDVRTLQQRLSKVRERLGLDSPYVEALRKIDTGLDEFERQTSVTDEVQKALVARLLERVEHIERSLPDGPSDSTESSAQRSSHMRDGLTDDQATAFWRRAHELIIPLREALQQMMTAIPGSLDSERALNDARAALRRLKQHLLGGPIRTWLVQGANPTEDELREVRNRLFDQFQGGLVTAGAATGVAAIKVLIGLVILILALYFFLADGPAMLAALMRLSPLDDQYEQELLDEFIKISRAVVVATLLSALVQGVLAGLGFWVAGVNAVFLLTSITAVFALIPFFGAWSVWVPVCLYHAFYDERPVAAAILAAYCALIVSTSDNVVKALVLHGQSRLHPLLALLSVLGGVAALGPIGILVGPMVVVFLQTLLKIMQREVAAMDERAAASGGASALARAAEAFLRPYPSGASVASTSPRAETSPAEAHNPKQGAPPKAPTSQRRRRRNKQ